MNRSQLYEILCYETDGAFRLARDEFYFLARLSTEKQIEHLEVELYYTESTTSGYNTTFQHKKYLKTISLDEYYKTYYLKIDETLYVSGVMVGFKYNYTQFAGQPNRGYFGSEYMIDTIREVANNCEIKKNIYAKVVFKY